MSGRKAGQREWVRVWTAASVMLVTLMGMAWVTASRSEASVPTRVTCSDEWQHARSSEAKVCRENGWEVSSKYVLTPGHVPVYLNLPSCQWEDGAGDRACSWNVNAGDGNGYGLRYLVLNVRSDHGTSGKRYVYLRECFGARCHTSVAR